MERLNGIYRGTVLKHLDYGRMKVFIPGVYPDEYKTQPDSLPTAEMMSPIFCGGNTNGNGVYSYPNLNSSVICQFFNGDQNFPIVLGTTLGADASRSNFDKCYSDDNDKIPDWRDNGKSSNSNESEDNKCTEPHIHKIVVGRSSITIYEGGTIKMGVNGSKGESSIVMDGEGNIIINCSGNLQVKAKNVKTTAKNDINEIACGNFIINSGNTLWEQSKEISINATNGVLTLRSPDNRKTI